MKLLKYFVFYRQFVGAVIGLTFLVGCGFASSRTEVLGSAAPESGSGTPINSGNLKQIRIVDGSGNLFTTTSVNLSVGQTLNLKAAVYSLGGSFVKDIDVFWSVKTLSGPVNSGIGCAGVAVAQCSFTPTMIGSAVIEVTYVGSDSEIVMVNAVSPVVLVTSLVTPASMDIHSGNLQRAVANTDIGQPLKVIVKDSFGQPISGAGVNFAVTGGGGSVTPTAITTDGNGIAQTVLRVGTTAGNLNNLVTASIASNPAISQNFQVSTDPASADHLVYVTQPAGSYSLLLLQAQPVVELKDIFGNTVPSTANVVLSLQTGTGVVGGTTTRAMVNGRATFTDLTYSIVENGVVLRATSGSMTVDSVAFNVITSGGSVDRDPNDIIFDMAVSYTAGTPGRQTSNMVVLTGFGVPIDISVSGSGTPKLKLNGGPEVDTLSGVTAPANLEIAADAPTVLGTKNIITVYMGSRIESWEVAYADSSRVAPVFVTSGNYNGSRGGLGGIDGVCQSAATAAGLGGTWVSLQGDHFLGPKQRAPWNFGIVKRLDGVLIANSWQDFWDGTWAAPLNVTELQTVKNSNVWWGGLANGNQGGSYCFLSGNSWSVTTSFFATYTASSSLGISTGGGHDCSNTYAFYCIGDASAVADTDPVDVDFLGDVSYSSGTRTSSNIITVTGINTTIPVSISGASGTPRMKINGGAEVTSGTASLGDTIQLVMDAPTVLGTQNSASVVLGADSKSWWVGYADNSKIKRIFVTRNNSTAIVGGSAAFDSYCQNAASAGGNPGTWKAMLSDTASGGGARNRIPYDWGTLKRLDGATVATSWQDLWDGSIANPINIDEYGETVNTSVWSAAKSDGSLDLGNNSGTCTNWTAGVTSVAAGLSGSSGAAWINSGYGTCGSSPARSVYCVEVSTTPDTAPTLVPNAFYMKVSYIAGAGGRASSNIVKVRGISQAVSVSIAGPGNPTFKINGGAEVTTGTVNWEDTLQIVMDAPAVLGTKNTAVVTIGSSSFNFNVGYADSGRVARVFASSATYNGTINSLGGADSLCNSLATTAGFLGQWKSIFTPNVNFPLRDHMVFNWGILKRMDGVTIASNWDDLWDGAIQNPINVDENGVVVTGNVRTGGTNEGQYNSLYNCLEYVSGSGSINSEYGVISTVSQWLSTSSLTPCTTPTRIYCIENTLSEDTTPNPIEFRYLTYQNVSTRVSSQVVTVTGITAAANVTLTGSQGNPAFKINGGAEVTSGSVSNGDTLTLVMDTPAALNQSHKMEIQVGGSPIIPWRVWTGNPSSGVRKRVFVTSTTTTGNIGGVAGADAICQARANTNAGLSAATWKAIISGVKSAEGDWAINRIGYAGSELWSINPDGTTRTKVIDGSALWSSPHNLNSRIEYNEAGVLLSGVLVWTGTTALGFAGASGVCIQWTTSTSSFLSETGNNANSSDSFISSGTPSGCNNPYRLYCIEQ